MLAEMINEKIVAASLTSATGELYTVNETVVIKSAISTSFFSTQTTVTTTFVRRDECSVLIFKDTVVAKSDIVQLETALTSTTSSGE